MMTTRPHALHDQARGYHDLLLDCQGFEYLDARRTRRASVAECSGHTSPYRGARYAGAAHFPQIISLCASTFELRAFMRTRTTIRSRRDSASGSTFVAQSHAITVETADQRSW